MITLEHQPFSHSYRHELETYYHALQDADTILELPHSITQWMDCKAGLDKIEAPVYGPRDTMGTDMDIVMAYHALKEKSKHTVSHDWVMGHAKEKKKDKPETITDMEHVNEDCDDDANDRVEENISPEPFTPLPGYRAMLKLGDNWVTTLFRENVQFANVAPATVEYVVKRLNITLDTFHDINWGAVGRVRAPHRIAQRVRTSKMMYRWMPVGHNWKKCKLPSDKCPCCGANDETFEHLLSCENTTMQDVRNEARKDFRLNCEALDLPLHFTSTLVSIINLVFEPVVDRRTKPILQIDSLRDAVKQQETIGFYNMLVGFMSKAWTTALDDLNVEQPE